MEQQVDQVEDVTQFAAKLEKQDHYAWDEIKERCQSVKDRHSRLLQSSNARRQKLGDSKNYQVFLRNLYEVRYRGSYMSGHVLLNLLNELGKRDKMRGLQSILSLFRNEFNKFNNTGAPMLDCIYHMTLKILKNCIFGVKTSRVSIILHNVIKDVITFPVNL